MPFIKAHWISLAAGLVGVVGIVGLVLGMRQNNVVEAMNKDVAQAAEINQRKTNPKNEESIAAEKERGRLFEEQYKATLDEAARINARQPLLEGVFPKPPQLELAYRFQEEYRKQLLELPRALMAGDEPSLMERQDEEEMMRDQDKKKKDQEQPGADSTSPGGPAVDQPAVSGDFGMAVGRSGPPMEMGGRMMGRGGPVGAGPGTGGAAPTNEAERRAAVRKARNIRTYATVDPARSSFHIDPSVYTEQPTAPAARDMWHAQVSLWVQEDIVKSIAELNDEAAKQLDAKDANVENMPVKRIVNVQVQGYVTSDGTMVNFPSLSSGSGGAMTGAASPSFTAGKGNDRFDVVRFTLAVVVDQRELLRLIDRITRENFYQLIGAGYESVPATEGLFMYGGAPVVRATLDFEGYMARKVYVDMMPDEVREELKIPKRGEAPGAAKNEPEPPGR